MIGKMSVNRETMDAQRHWENIYSKKAADAVSWYRPHLETSLELIERAAPEHSASIIDIGGGESTFFVNDPAPAEIYTAARARGKRPRRSTPTARGMPTSIW